MVTTDAQAEQAGWVIHSSSGGRPTIRGWARTEEEAQVEAERLCAEDGDNAEDEYFLTRASEEQLQGLQSAGLISPSPATRR
jgi:hypothetical protein